MSEFESARDKEHKRLTFGPGQSRHFGADDFIKGADWAFQWCKKHLVTELHGKRLEELGAAFKQNKELKKNIREWNEAYFKLAHVESELIRQADALADALEETMHELDRDYAFAGKTAKEALDKYKEYKESK